MIHHITIDQLKGITNGDGLILRGCGGEPTDWQNGINELLTDAGILKNGGEFKDIYVFKDEELTNILYPFDDMTLDKLDIGKLTMWRLQEHDNFAGIWYSDYLDNMPNIDSMEVADADIESNNGIEDSEVMDDSESSIHPITIYIENAYESNDNSFEIPLPTTKKEIQPLLEDTGIENLRDIRIDAVHSDMPGVGERLQQIISDNGTTPDTLDELNYLATRIRDLVVNDDEYGKIIFLANIEAGLNCSSIKEVINITFKENINCYEILPFFSLEDYGEFLVTQLLQDEHAEAFTRLNDSKNPQDHALVAHIEKLEKHTNYEAFGMTTAEEENGITTEQGYLLGSESFQQFYHGVQDIPTNCCLLKSEEDVERFMKIDNVNIAETIVKLHAVGCRNMEYVADNVKSFLDEHKRFAEGLNRNFLANHYILVLNSQSVSIAPMTEICKQDSEMFKFTLDMSRKAEQNRPDIRIFAIRVNNGNDEVAGQNARGGFIELSPKALKSYITHNAISPNSAYILRDDGTKNLYDLYAWGLELQQRGNSVDYVLNYSNHEMSGAIATLGGFIGDYELTSHAESFEFHLPRISNPYKQSMAESETPHPYNDMIRIDKESAKEILASENAEVYNLADDKVTKVNIFEFLRPSSFSEYSNLAIKHSDAKILDKWAERKVGEIVQQIERGELSKSSGKEERE